MRANQMGPCVSVLLLACALGARGAEYWVAPGGDDGNAGGRDAPFASVRHAAARMRAGDTCWLRGGRYRESLHLKDVKGTADAPLVFRGCPGDTAVLDGSVPVPGPWVRHRDRIYRTTVDRDVWQLFIGGAVVQLARWPNASLADGTGWDLASCMRSTDRGYDYRERAYTGRTRPGVIHDRNPPARAVGADRDEGASGVQARQGVNNQTLAATGIDFTGAVAMLNIGHWLTWARPVLEHAAGRDHFTFNPQGTEMRKTCNYYLLGAACLDRENEWWYEPATKTITLYAPDGADPNTLDVSGRIHDACVVAERCEHIRFRGVHFFSGGLQARDCSRLVFEDCTFRYPSENKIVLGIYDWFNPRRFGTDRNGMFSLYGGRDNALLNCEIAYANSPLHLGGEGMRVENCSLHHIEWDLLSSGGSGSVQLGAGAIARHNTIHTAGNSEGLRPARAGATIEWNRLFNLGLLQHDGAAINVGNKAQPGAVVRYNWAHDSNRQGIRFDYGGPDAPDDRPAPPDEVADGVYAYNVIWNCRSNQVKGNRHVVHNNTVFHSFRFGMRERNGLCDIGISGFRYMHNFAFNEQTITRNNVAALASRSWALHRPESRRLPGLHDHNLNEENAAAAYLRDPINLDFRPRPGSAAIDGGVVIAKGDVPGARSRYGGMAYVGAAPDIGAYEDGAARYWIPGRRDVCASSPVPPDGAVGVARTADLMFLEAYRARSHMVRFGTSRDGLHALVTLRDTNIASPGALAAEQTYYWRVDARGADGSVVPGETWSFTVR